MAAFLKSHGREAVVWNDALKGGGRLSPEITLQYWVGGDDASTVAHANAGGAVIQSPNLSYYLDMCYGVIPLDRAYAYVPYFPEQNRKESTIGVETPIWTEYMPDMKKGWLYGLSAHGRSGRNRLVRHRGEGRAIVPVPREELPAVSQRAWD